MLIRGAYQSIMRLTVFGTGYLGATHAACMAELGHEVVGVDVDPGKIAKLSDGVVPFYEPGLEDVLRRNLDAGRLRFTTSYRMRPHTPTCISSASARRSERASTPLT